MDGHSLLTDIIIYNCMNIFYEIEEVVIGMIYFLKSEKSQRQVIVWTRASQCLNQYICFIIVFQNRYSLKLLGLVILE